MTEKDTRYTPTNKVVSKIENYDESAEDGFTTSRLIFMGFLAITLTAGIVGTDESKGMSSADVKFPSKLIETTKSFDAFKESLKPESPAIKPTETVESIKESVKPVETTKNSGSITIGATVLSAMSCDAELNCATNDPDVRIYKVEKDGVVTVVADY